MYLKGQSNFRPRGTTTIFFIDEKSLNRPAGLTPGEEILYTLRGTQEVRDGAYYFRILEQRLVFVRDETDSQW